MPVAQGDPAKRDVDKARTLKSWRQVSLPRAGEPGRIQVGVLVPLVFAMNVIVAIVVWYVVESLLR